MENGTENIENVHNSNNTSNNMEMTESVVEAKDQNNTITENDHARNYKREREREEEEEEEQKDQQHLHLIQEVHDKNIVLEQNSDTAFIDNDNDQLEEYVDEMEDNNGGNDDDDNADAEFVDMLWRTSELQALLATHHNQHNFAVATASFEKCTLEKFYMLIHKLLSGMTVPKEKENNKLEEHYELREEEEQGKTESTLQNKANICVTHLQPCIGKHMSRVSSANNLLESCIYNKFYNNITETTTTTTRTTTITDGVNRFNSDNYQNNAKTTMHAYNTWRSYTLQQNLRNLFNLLQYECERYHDEIRHNSTIRKTMERYMSILQSYWSNFTTKLENVLTDSKTVSELEFLHKEEKPYCQLPEKRSKAEQEQREQVEPFVEEEQEYEYEREQMENGEELCDFTSERKRISEDVQFVHLLENATSLITLPQRQEAMTQLLNYLSMLCEQNMEYITHITPTLQRKILWYKDKVIKLMPMIEECAISTAQHNLSVMNRCMTASYKLIPHDSTKELSEFSTETQQQEWYRVEEMETNQTTNCFVKYIHLMNRRSQLQLTLLVLCTLYCKEMNTTKPCNNTTDDYDIVNSRQQADEENHIALSTHVDYSLECKSLQKERQELIKESVMLTREMVYVKCLQKECGTLFEATNDKSQCSNNDTNNVSDANEKEEVNKEAAQEIEDVVIDEHTKQLMKPNSVIEHSIAVNLMEQLRINLTNILSYALTQLFCYEGDTSQIKTKERAENDAVNNKHDDKNNNNNNNNNNAHEIHAENHTTEHVENITSSADTSPLDEFSEHEISHSSNTINMNDFLTSEVSIAQLTYLYENVLSRSHSLYALLTENGRWRAELASFDKTLHILLGVGENEMTHQDINVNVNFVQNANNQCIANYDRSNIIKECNVGKAFMEIVSEIKRAMALSLQGLSVEKFQQQSLEHSEEKEQQHEMFMHETQGHTCTSNDEDDGDDYTMNFAKCKYENNKSRIDTNIQDEVLSELSALSKTNAIPIQTIEEEIIQKYNELHNELMLSASCFVEKWDKECVEPVRQLCGDVAFLIRLYLLQIEQFNISRSSVQFDSSSNCKSNVHNWEVNNKLLELLQILDNLIGKVDNTENITTNQEEDITITSENVERSENGDDHKNFKLANVNLNTINKNTEWYNMATSLVNNIVPSTSLLPDSTTRAAEIYKPFASLFTASNTQLEEIKQKYATEDSSVHDLTQFVEWCSGVDVQNIQTLLATAQDTNLQLELQLCVEDEAQERRTLKLEVQYDEEFRQILCQEREERKSVALNMRKARIANRSAFLAELENEWEELQRHNAEMERQLEEISQHEADRQRQQELEYKKEEEEREEHERESEPLQEQEKQELWQEENELEPMEFQDEQTQEEHVIKNDGPDDEQITQNNNTQNMLVNTENNLLTQQTEQENEEEEQSQQDKENESNHKRENHSLNDDEENYNDDKKKVDNDEGDEFNRKQAVKEIYAANSNNRNSINNTDAWANSLVEDTSETSNNAEINDHSSVSNLDKLSDHEDVNIDNNALIADTNKDVVNILNIDSAENISHDVNNISSNDELAVNRETLKEELEKLQEKEESKLAEAKETETMPLQTDTTEEELHSQNEEGQEEVQQQEEEWEQQQQEHEKEKEQELKEESNVNLESTSHEVANTNAQNISSPFLDDFAFDDDDDDDDADNDNEE